MTAAIPARGEPKTHCRCKCGRTASSAAFTLIELMVAVTGGLFVTMVVFALARQGSQFYQRESRIAETTLGNVVAFDRLTMDISRAGFLSTPNLRNDPLFCGNRNSLPQELRNLASVRITNDDNAAANPVLKAALRTPQFITLSGAYDSVERYATWKVDENVSGGYTVRLQTNSGALSRFGFMDAANTVADKTAMLARLFPATRVLRLLNMDTGTFQLAIITQTRTDGVEAYIDLSNPTPPTLNLEGERCGLRGNVLVNVINIVRYRLRTVKAQAGFDGYQLLFETGSQPFEDNRLELVREELDAEGVAIVGTQEVVAEYAVDLQFGLTTVNNTASVLPSVFTTVADVTTIAGDLNAIPTARPQDIRAVRARLSLRSREVDRGEDITPGTNIAAGLYRIKLEDATTKASGYARVRTLQTDAIVGSQMELRW